MLMQINSGFSRLSSANFVAQVQLIVTSLTGNANFPAPWPANVPTLAQIQADLASFQTAFNDTASGDKTRVIDRNTTRSKLATELQQLASYLQTTAQGDPGLLVTTGFPMRQQSPRVLAPEPPLAPQQFNLVRGPLSGSLIASSGRVPKAGAYDVQTATADPTVEANWSAVGTFKNCRRIELDGLTVGKVYSVRMRAIGTAGPGAWTPATSLMVV